MTIRLIIPQCSAYICTHYCQDSANIQNRLQLLDTAISTSPVPDLIITSNNFFDFHVNCNVNLHHFITNRFMQMIRTNMSIKLPLIIGFDLRIAKNRQKCSKKNGKTKKGMKQGINPFNGIDAVVVYFDVKKNSYVYRSHIWECWILELVATRVSLVFQHKINKEYLISSAIKENSK